MDATLTLVASFATSAGIGLLVGLERERKPTAKAGLRTFTLIALAGTLGGLLADATGSAWVLAAGLVCIGGSLVAAYLQDQEAVHDDSGTTTVIAAVVVFLLGAANYYGYRTLAVALGVGITALLYYKAELEGFSRKLTSQDIRSMLQFAVLTAVILPLLPDRSFGPYGVLNPQQVWLMVVLVAAVSLAGYLAWRLTWGRHGLLLTGVLGGAVSSTATTLVAARAAAAGTQRAAAALLVILLANATMLVRVLVLIAVVSPPLLPRAMIVIVPALLAALGGVAWRWTATSAAPPPDDAVFANPTQLRTALGFGAVYAVILLLVAWANDVLGERGVLALAAVSGLSDVDAITLSSLRLQSQQSLEASTALTAIGVAVGSNLVFKTALAAAAGGRELRGPTLRAFGAVLLALVAGLWGLHALA
jgi:uncharacterized membrane protein (DUF4010 family)